MNKKIVIGLCGLAGTIVLYIVLVAVFIYAPVASFSNRPYSYFDPLSFLGEDPLTTLGVRLNIIYIITFIMLAVSFVTIGTGIQKNIKRNKS